MPRLVTTATRPVTATELVAAAGGGLADLPVAVPIVGTGDDVTYG
jgi:hypothetical protein